MKGRIKGLEIGTPRFYSEILTEQSTTGAADLGGPSVTIQVPSASFVSLYAQCDAQEGVVFLEEENGDFGSTQIMEATGGYTTKGTVPGTIEGGNPPLVGPLTFPASEGMRVYRLTYGAESGATGLFRNRKLWVWTLG